MNFICLTAKNFTDFNHKPIQPPGYTPLILNINWMPISDNGWKSWALKSEYLNHVRNANIATF